MCDNKVENMITISNDHIQNLLQNFSKNTYRAKEPDPIGVEALQRAVELMKVDYDVLLLSNAGGELSSHYPSQLIILECEKVPQTDVNSFLNTISSQRTPNTIYEYSHDPLKLRELINKARFARCRARFPMPVILYKGKYICRSATLSGGPEIYGRSGLDYFFYGMDYDNIESNQENQSDWQLFDRVRNQDIKLLKSFNVGTIIDFMVEKKKVKFGVNVTSSEKVDKENRYSDFTIISLPYPGCEFFKEYRDNDYSAKGLVFDWSQGHVDASICVPADPFTTQLHTHWNKYKEWDLVEITENYMKLMLKYLQDGSTGILIHCISGWDRTPLFISLLRLSLWADGSVHQGLDAHQILYLTIAYDWMLYGHHLSDRLSKGEEIFFFCFYMLKHLAAEEFSVISKNKNTKCNDRNPDKPVSRTDSEPHLDGMLLESDPHGSNISLNSSCSSISNKSQEHPTGVWYHFPDEYTNGNPTFSSEMTNSLLWPGQTRRTSPVAVPAATSLLRQRQESFSSVSIGSWQMISGTGSLRSTDSNSTIDSSSVNSNRYDANHSQESSCTLLDEEDSLMNITIEGFPQRKERLLKVRALFYNCYCSTVGFKFKNGTDLSLCSMLGNIAEKVGLSQRTPV